MLGQLALALSVSVSAFLPPSLHCAQPAFGLEEKAVPANTLTFEYTHLEVNGMLWKVSEPDLSFVIDPIASQLDFGIPWGYRANKKVLGERETLDVITQAAPTHCLLSMGLDDHTHLPTLTKLVEQLPELKFIVAPSARDKIVPLVDSSRVTVLQPGESIALSPLVKLTATEGALVGPPWQARENGWLLRIRDRAIYFEPHADVRDEALRGLRADIVVSPVKEQSLPAQIPKPGQFTLVYGGKRTLEIAQSLQASVIVPLGNGDLDVEGPLSELVQASGTVEDFEHLVKEANERQDSKHIRVERTTPGVPLRIHI